MFKDQTRTGSQKEFHVIYLFGVEEGMMQERENIHEMRGLRYFTGMFKMLDLQN